jgi:hypothetical protein
MVAAHAGSSDTPANATNATNCGNFFMRLSFGTQWVNRSGTKYP